jgi:hypothetical protein
MDKVTWGIISTYAALLPLLAGMFVFRKAEITFRIFALFILYGFLTDFSVWKLNDTEFDEIARSVFYVYCLAESLFFTWFLQKTSDHLMLTRGITICYYLFPAMWFFMHVSLSTFGWIDVNDIFNSQFITVSEITIAVFAAYSIIDIFQKKEKSVLLPQFWFNTGIFLYCFGTFAISSFLQTPQQNKVWYVHNIINIVTYLMFTRGFLLIAHKQKPLAI